MTSKKSGADPIRLVKTNGILYHNPIPLEQDLRSIDQKPAKGAIYASAPLVTANGCPKGNPAPRTVRFGVILWFQEPSRHGLDLITQPRPHVNTVSCFMECICQQTEL